MNSIIYLTVIFLISTNVYGAKIALLASSGYEDKWIHLCIEGINSELNKEDLISIYYTDSIHKPQTELDKSILEKVNSIYDFKPDVIMIADDMALKYSLKHFKKSEKPIVFFGVSANPRNYFKNGVLPPNIYGIIDRREIVPMVRYLKKIVKSKKFRVLVVYDESPTSYILSRYDMKNRSYRTVDGVSLDAIHIKEYQYFQSKILNSENYDYVILRSWSQFEAKNGMKSAKEVLTWVSENTKTPVFSLHPSIVGKNGVAGALSYTGFDHGKDAIRKVNDILQKRVVKRISSSHESKFYYSGFRLKKFDIKIENKTNTIDVDEMIESNESIKTK